MGWRGTDAISFQGLKRSGNHAVIQWLGDNLGNVTHFNNVLPIADLIDGSRTDTFPCELKPLISGRRRWYARFLPVPRRPLVSIEDYPFSRSYFTGADRVSHVLILRSAESLFASRIHKAFRTEMPAYPREMNWVMLRAMHIWADHVDSLIENAGRQDFVGIIFDRWVRDPAYRDKVAARLGFEATVSPRAARAKEGGGSSFEGSAPVADAGALMRRHEQLSAEERELLESVLNHASVSQAMRKLSAFSSDA